MLFPLSSPGQFQIQKLWALVIRNFTREGVMLQALVYFLIGSDTEKLNIYKLLPKIQYNLNTTACSRLHDSNKRKFARKSQGSRGEASKHNRRFPFDLNFRFEFSATSNSE